MTDIQVFLFNSLKDNIMETKDPALTKTRIADSDTNLDHTDNHNEIEDHKAAHKSTKILQETVIGTKYDDDDEYSGDHNHENIHHNHYNVMSNEDDIEDHTTINKGTDTFQESVVDSEHVNEDDNPARQPDPRDQQGETPFDEGINGDSVSSEAPNSEGITDMNRYASIDNAQTRVLSPDEKD